MPGTVIGAVAASLLGRPRATRDIGAMVTLDESDWEAFFATGSTFGFVLRLLDPLPFADRARVSLMRHAASGIDIDIAFGALPFEEEVVAQTVWHDVSGIQVPFSAPEDLIIM